MNDYPAIVSRPRARPHESASLKSNRPPMRVAIAPLVAKGVVPQAQAQTIAFVAKRSRSSRGQGHPSVAEALLRCALPERRKQSLACRL
jgi:hypothetical protein